MKKLILLLAMLPVLCLGAFAQQEPAYVQKIKDCEARWPREDLLRANTAGDCPYLDLVSKQSIYFANLARINGPLFIETFLQVNDHDKSSDKYKELVYILSKSKGRIPLRPDEAMSKLAQSHAADKGKKGHVSADGTFYKERVFDKFNCGNCVSENIAWSDCSNGLFPVLQMMSVAWDRSHLLDPRMTNIGVGISTEKDGRDVMVHEYGLGRDDEFADFVISRYSDEMLKKADVARKCSYMSDYQKDLIMFINLARLDMAGFYRIAFQEFSFIEDEAVRSFFKGKEGERFQLLYPDMKMYREVFDAVVNDGYSVYGPNIPTTDHKRNNYSRRDDKVKSFCEIIVKYMDVLFDGQYLSVGMAHCYVAPGSKIANKDIKMFTFALSKEKSSDGFLYQDNPSSGISIKYKDLMVGELWREGSVKSLDWKGRR